MRYCCLILILGCLMPTTVARAEEHLFAEMLYWHATEPVDWVLNTNRDPSNQYVDYETLTYDWTPGLRVGGGIEGSGTPRSTTRILTSTLRTVPQAI